MLDSEKFLMFILTNGRKQWISHTIKSWGMNLKSEPSKKIIFDDSGSAEYFLFLKNTFGKDFEIIKIKNNNGRGGAINFIFEYLKRTSYKYFLEIEEDWVLNRELDLSQAIDVLEKDKKMLQMRIVRSPWYDKYNSRDFYFGSHINSIISKDDAVYKKWNNHYTWRSSYYFWSHNPNLFKRNILDLEYPTEPAGGKNIELLFGELLFNLYPNSHVGIWAKNEYDNYVSHIGLKP